MSTKRQRSDSGSDVSATRRRVTRGVDLSAVDDGTVCVKCSQTIPYTSQCAVLQPCACKVCLVCLLASHAQRGKSLLACSCGSEVASHQILAAQRVPEGAAIMYNTAAAAPSEEELMKYQPWQYLLKKEGPAFVASEEEGAMFVLYLGQWEKTAGKVGGPEGATTTTRFTTKAFRLMGGRAASEGYAEQMCEFFGTLHPFLVGPSVTPRSKIPTCMPREFFDHAVEDYSPLLAAIYGLGTGNGERDLEKITGAGQQDHQSQYLAAAAARDVIIRITHKYPHHFQRMLGDQLEMQHTTSLFRDLVSAFRIGYSRDLADKSQCQAVLKSLLEGVSIGSEEMALLNGDNFGLVRKGRQASYSQWIIFQDIKVRLQRLKQLKIHAEKVEDRLARDPAADWLQLVKEDQTEMELAEDVVAPNDGDFEALTHSVMEGIKYAIELDLAGGVKIDAQILRFGYVIDQETRKQLESGELLAPVDEEEESGSDPATSNDDREVVERRIPRNYTPREDEDEEAVNSTVGAAAHYPAGLNHGMHPASVETERSDFYGRNNATLNVVKADLAKKESVCMIAQYTYDVRKMILQKWYEEQRTANGAPPPSNIDVQKLPPAYILSCFLCDGQPAAQLSAIIAADNRRFYCGDGNQELPDLFPDNPANTNDDEFERWFKAINVRMGLLGRGRGDGHGTRFYGKFWVFPGGFHACMKLHNCCGIMFGNFVAVFFGAWRNTPNKVNWILFPSDPRQLEQELPQYILLHYRSAFIYLWGSRGKDPEKIPSAAEVHEYMLKRAVDSPFRQAVLLQLRYAEITKLLRMSARVGKRGSVNLFLTAVRFASTLWATAHAVDYCRLAGDLLMFHKCASPAMKELYANEIFTRLSAFGKSMFADENMEKSIKHFRDPIGKTERPGDATEKKMEAAAVAIPQKPPQAQVRQELRTGSAQPSSGKTRSHERLHENSPLIQGHELVHNQIKLWHPTDRPIIGDYGKPNPKYAEPNSYDLPGKETLNPEVLQCFEIGKKRMEAYFQKYYIDKPFAVERSEKDVPLTKILATSVDRNEEKKKAIDRAVSVNTDELNKAMNKEEVAEELDALGNELYSLDVDFDVRKMTKKDMIKKLIELRRAQFDLDDGAKSKAHTDALEAFALKYPSEATPVSFEGLATTPIYGLSESVYEMARYKTTER
ncbi:hypothetical protein ACHAXT_003794 [Thalassiosira profunda]